MSGPLKEAVVKEKMMIQQDAHSKFLDNAIKSSDSPFFRELESSLEERCIIEGREVIMLGANNYLGLTTHPEIISAAKRALKRYGTGCTGSRLLNGTTTLHKLLEKRLASFVGKEAALIFSAGFLSNLGVLGALGTRSTHFIADRDSHASIIDGLRVSYAKAHRFEHNDPCSLGTCLEKLPAGTKKWVVVEGVYSMLGDVSKLPEIIAVAKEYDAGIILDDAHGMGVMGENGRGTANHFNVVSDVDLIIGTFSKSFASYGGFVAGDQYLIDYFKYTARSFIFTASLPPVNVATVIAVLDMLQENTEHVDRLWDNTQYFNNKLVEAGVINEASSTPIIPVHIGDNSLAIYAWNQLFSKGVYVNAVVSPAVPMDAAMLRVSIMGSMKKENLDTAARTITDTYHSLGLEK